MKRFSVSILSVCFGAAGFVLRLLQNRTGFEPDTGLPVHGNIPAMALTMLPDGAAPAVVLILGGGIALTGFQMMLWIDSAE